MHFGPLGPLESLKVLLGFSTINSRLPRIRRGDGRYKSLVLLDNTPCLGRTGLVLFEVWDFTNFR